MSLIRLTEHCWALPFTTDADRPTLGCICGTAHVLGVDAGNSAAHVQLMAQAMQHKGLPPIDRTALTHSHWDHTYGLHALNGPSYATAETQALLQQMSGWIWTLPAMEQRLQNSEDILFCHEFIQVEYPDLSQIRVVPATHTYDSAMTIDLGGVTARLMRWANSHAADHAVVYVPEDKVIYLGDICYKDLHHQPECWHAKRYRQLIDHLEDCDFEIAVPGHQLPLSKAELLAELHDNLLHPEALVLDD